jgi:hypothetical protein
VLRLNYQKPKGGIIMRILEYENLGLFVGFNNSGYYITPHLDEACEFGKPQNDLELKETRRRIDKQLFGKVDFYRKGHLCVRERKGGNK